MTNLPSLRRAEVVLNLHLRHAWRYALLEKLDPHLIVGREERIFGIIRTCDPTPQGKYLAWLSAWRRRWWEAHGLMTLCDMVELDRLASGMEMFHAVRPHLPAELRDINQFRTVSELLCVENHLTFDGVSQLRKAERVQAYADSDLLFDQGRWKLVYLKSQAAARWWGKGTRWCTSARIANQFEAYASKGPLLVLLTPGDRYQLAVGTREFRDAADRSANLVLALRGAPPPLRDMIASTLGTF